MKIGWKNINGFEGLYKINGQGVVLSVINNIIMKPGIVRGYYQVGLRKDRKYHQLYVHRLVALRLSPIQKISLLLIIRTG